MDGHECVIWLVSGLSAEELAEVMRLPPPAFDPCRFADRVTLITLSHPPDEIDPATARPQGEPPEEVS